MSAAVCNTHFLSRDDLSRSSTEAVWQFTNQDWGCFKPTHTTFTRELGGGIYFQLDLTKPAKRFIDLFQEEYGVPYDMDSPGIVPEAKQLIDKWYGEGTFTHLSESIDQSAMQFFNDVIEKKSVEHLGLIPPIMLKKAKPNVCIHSDHAGDLQIRTELSYSKVIAPDDPKNPETPFEVNVKASFRILHGGMQLVGIRLDGKHSNLARQFIMGDKHQLSVMEKVQHTLGTVGEQAQKHPLLALTMVSASASLGLCVATQLGADIGPIEALAKISGGEIREFFLVAGVFTAAGSLARLVQLGAENWVQRKGLMSKAGDIIAAFNHRMKGHAAAADLCQEDPKIASQLFGEPINDAVACDRSRSGSVRSLSSDESMSVSSLMLGDASSVEMTDSSSDASSVGSRGPGSPRGRCPVRGRRRCSDPRVDKLGALMQQLNKFDLDTAVKNLDPEPARSQSAPPALRHKARHPRTDAPYGATKHREVSPSRMQASNPGRESVLS